MRADPEILRRARGATLRLRLDGGSAAFDVDPLRPGQRFLLALPDGELEVKGTRFTAETDGLRTLAVRVQEGTVVLRLVGSAPRVLRAGDAWPPHATTPETTSPERAAASAPVVGIVPTRAAASPAKSPVPAQSRRPKGPPRRAQVLPSGAATVDPDTRTAVATKADGDARTFEQAMLAFSAGDYGQSEARFTTFIRDNPHDDRVEDARFLRAVGLSRRGELDAASKAARAYPKAHPAGLRRRDAMRLIRETGSGPPADARPGPPEAERVSAQPREDALAP